MIDIYRKLVNKYGKVKVWSCNTDELCGLVDDYLEGVFGEKD